MKLTYIFSRAGRTALAAALGLFIAAPSISDAAVVVLKQGGDIDYSLAASYGSGVTGGDFGAHTQFLGLGNTATDVHVDDARLPTTAHSPDLNLGDENPMQNSANTAQGNLVNWDLSGLPGFVGGTVNAAVIRLYQTGGNGVPILNTVTTHDWDEAVVTNGSPIGTPFGAGPGEWGAGAIFSHAGDTTNDFINGTAPQIDNVIVGAGYNTWDATSDVQAMANGAPHYGWAISLVNNSFRSSEDLVNNGSRPALFIDYTPVPEPTSLALLSLGVVSSLLVRRKR